MEIFILVASDRAAAGTRADRAGPALAEAIRARGWTVAGTEVLGDDREALAVRLAALADEGQAAVVLTAGGTGLGPRDVTPEATLAVAERVVPGLAELMRAESLKITANAALSRAAAVVRRGCLIVNLPGSPKAATECFAIVAPVLEHAAALLRGEDPH